MDGLRTAAFAEGRPGREGENVMKKSGWILTWAFTAVLAFAWGVIPARTAIAASGDDRVALVNGTAITRHALDREMSGVRAQFARMGQPLSKQRAEEIRKRVLDNLINLELLYQESRKEGIRVDDAEVQKRFDNLKKRFPSEKEFKKTLRRMNLTESVMRRQLSRGIAIEKMLDRKIVKKITVPDKNIRAYYEAHKKLFVTPERIRASHILIKVEPKANKAYREKARKKIEMIREKISKGEDFAALAKKYSQGPSGAKGGDLGYFSRGQMVKPFEDAAFALKPGEVSGIVETRFGFHIIKVADRKAAVVSDYGEVKEKIRQNLVREETRKAVGNYVATLKKTAEIRTFPEQGRK